MELVPCSTLPSPTACINAPPLLRCIHVVSSLLCSLKSAGEPGDLGAGGDPPRYSPTCTYLKSGEVAGWPCQLHVLFRRESRLWMCSKIQKLKGMGKEGTQRCGCQHRRHCYFFFRRWAVLWGFYWWAPAAQWPPDAWFLPCLSPRKIPELCWSAQTVLCLTLGGEDEVTLSWVSSRSSWCSVKGKHSPAGWGKEWVHAVLQCEYSLRQVIRLVEPPFLEHCSSFFICIFYLLLSQK